MNLKQRNNVHIHGDGSSTMIFAHGFGCDQNMWRFMAPRFADRYRVITFDLVGSGKSDLSAYDASKYDTLGGYLSTTQGRIPQNGTTFTANGARFTILDAEPQKVNRVQIELLPAPETAAST